MNLKTLSDNELQASIKRLKKSETEATLAILYHLIEIEDRGLFRDAGYASLFDYCHRGLGYSEGGAGRRVAGARCLREHPEVAGLLEKGELTLCNIATAAKSIRANETKIEEIVGKSNRAIQMLVAPTLERKPKEKIKPIVLSKKTPAVSGAESAVKEEREERYEIRFTVTKEVFEEFEELKAELSNQLGADMSVEAVFKKLLSLQKSKIVRKPSREARTDTRRIPAAVKREVRERDKCQCTYIAPDGTRCTEKRRLQFDHVIPFAVGGKTEAGNLRLSCPAHNRLMAELAYTKTYVRGRVEAKRGWAKQQSLS